MDNNIILREHTVITAAGSVSKRYNTPVKEYRDDNKRFGCRVDTPWGELRFVEMTPDSVMVFGDALWEPAEVHSLDELNSILSELNDMYADLAMLHAADPGSYRFKIS